MFNLKLSEKTKSWIWLLPILIVSLVFILDPRYFTSPPLRSDDWDHLVFPAIFDQISFIDLGNRRPLLTSLLALLSPLFGLHIAWYYVINWLVIFLSAVVVFLIIKQAFPKFSWLALPTALIYLIYPVNYARTWLVTIVNSLALLISLISVVLIVQYAQTGKLMKLIFANLLFLVSLSTYEIGFGMVMLAATLIFLFHKGIPVKRRYLIGAILLTGVIFLIWRIYVQPKLFVVEDNYLASLDLSIIVVFRRYVQGLFIFLFNWIGPFLIGFGDHKYWVFVGLGGVIVLGFIIVLPKLVNKAKSDFGANYREWIARIKGFIKLSLIGGLFWAAGYIPVIFLWQPAFYGDSSRVNIAAIPGAALGLTAGIAGLKTFVFRKGIKIRNALIIMVMVLVVLGMAYQIHSQNIRFRVWEINKEFYRMTFGKIPGIMSGTKVVIVIPGYEALEPFEILPFRGDWEAESALRVLYNNPELFAEYYYLDNPSHPDNWIPQDSDLSRFIFVYFDPENSEIRIIEDPELALSLPFKAVAYDPDSRIVPFEFEIGKYRFLVE